MASYEVFKEIQHGEEWASIRIRNPHPPCRSDGATAAKITEIKRIIAFRDILIHGHDVIDNHVVWDVLQVKLPVLQGEVAELLQEN